MLAFFTTVGLGASFSLLKKGGILLIVYWLCAGVISIFQNIIGIAVGTAVGLEAPYAPAVFRHLHDRRPRSSRLLRLHL